MISLLRKVTSMLHFEKLATPCFIGKTGHPTLLKDAPCHLETTKDSDHEPSSLHIDEYADNEQFFFFETFHHL